MPTMKLYAKQMCVNVTCKHLSSSHHVTNIIHITHFTMWYTTILCLFSMHHIDMADLLYSVQMLSLILHMKASIIYMAKNVHPVATTYFLYSVCFILSFSDCNGQSPIDQRKPHLLLLLLHSVQNGVFL